MTELFDTTGFRPERLTVGELDMLLDWFRIVDDEAQPDERRKTAWVRSVELLETTLEGGRNEARR